MDGWMDGWMGWIVGWTGGMGGMDGWMEWMDKSHRFFYGHVLVVSQFKLFVTNAK